jgi:hypothetical protein
MQTTNYLRTRGHKPFVMFCSIFKQPGLGDKYENMGTIIDWVKHDCEALTDICKYSWLHFPTETTLKWVIFLV